jgi:hypothetical protein
MEVERKMPAKWQDELYDLLRRNGVSQFASSARAEVQIGSRPLTIMHCMTFVRCSSLQRVYS